MSSAPTSRRSFALVGLGAAALALLATLGAALLLPTLEPLAFLSTARRDGPAGALLFLAAIGLIAVAELPLVFYAIVRAARRPLPAPALHSLVGSYVAFPVVYGALGAILTGEGWWLWLMMALVLARLATSLLLDPAELAERATLRRAGRLPLAPAQAPPVRDLAAIRGFILDMDGVLYRGNQRREGAAEFVAHLNDRAIPYLCLTNNASRTAAMYESKLAALDIPVVGSRVLGAARATADWLRGQAAPGARLLVVGEAGLRDELAGAGFTLVEQAPADVVVVGIDFHLSYERLKAAALAIRQQARFVGTNPDTTFPSEEGLLPGNGATLAFLKAATGVEPTIVGKPQPAIFDVALDRLGLPPSQVAMVGDRLDTDILGGQRAGMATILLRGGVTAEAELAHSTIRPDWIFDDLAALLGALRPA